MYSSLFNRTFIDLFLKIGDELPRYSHVLSTLDSMHLISENLAARQHEFERIITSLTGTIADYQTLCDEITRLRDVYSPLQPSHAA